MSRLRATLARSAIDRDLHTHLSKAASAVQAAIDVCGQAVRAQRRGSESPYTDRRSQLSRAANLLSDIGHLEGSTELVDMRMEARALCSWLDGRERSAGVLGSSRRGQEYQNRLRRVFRFLAGGEVPLQGDEPEQEVASTESEHNPDSRGVLWERALELARQQGKANDDVYVMAIFMRLASRSESSG